MDLNLNRFFVGADYLDVDGLVQVGLRFGDVVRVHVRDRGPDGAQYAEGLIALLPCVDDDPYRYEIVDVLVIE